MARLIDKSFKDKSLKSKAERGMPQPNGCDIAGRINGAEGLPLPVSSFSPLFADVQNNGL
jgi:hypothetical protein